MFNGDNTNLSPLKAQLTSKWGWFFFFGLLLLIVGFVAAVSLPFASTAVILYIGIMMLLGGVTQIAHAFSAQQWGRLFFWLISGIIYTIGGIVCFTSPIFSTFIFTLLLGIMLIISGVMRIIVGLQNKGIDGWVWIVIAGIVTTFAGVLITYGWPENSFWVLGLFLAIDLIIQGWSLIAVSLGLKRLGKL